MKLPNAVDLIQRDVTDPFDTVLSGLEAASDEVLADEATRHVKQSLSSAKPACLEAV